MNAPKSVRGIQEADVWSAADALIAQGLRPTIERVRQHIGRGSPNTVSPMLEAWFATLGARLGVVEAAEAEKGAHVPEPVQLAAQQMWLSALEHAKQVAEQLLHERETVLAGAQQTHVANEKHLAQREEALHQQKKAMDDAMRLARSQAQELSRRLEEMQQLLHEREAQIQVLRNNMAEKELLREEDRKQNTQALQTAAEERQRLAEQFAGNERRMLAELDRARQEVLSSKKLHAESERRSQDRYEELHQRYLASEEALVASRNTQMAAEQTLGTAQERIADLKQLLAMREQVLQQAQEKSSPSADAVHRMRAARSPTGAGRPAKMLRKKR